MLSAPAQAEGLKFGCDTPADHFSQVSVASTNGPRVRGMINPGPALQGEYLHLGSVRLTSADGTRMVAFRLKGTGKKGEFLLSLQVDKGSGTVENAVTALQVTGAVPFDFGVDDAGAVTLALAGRTFTASGTALRQSKMELICSTGEFEFLDVVF